MLKKNLLIGVVVTLLLVCVFIFLYPKSSIFVGASDDLIVVTDDPYDPIQKFCLSRKCTYGVMNQAGKIIYRPVYDTIIIEKDFLVLIQDNHVKLIYSSQPDRIVLDLKTTSYFEYQDVYVFKTINQDYIIKKDSGDYYEFEHQSIVYHPYYYQNLLNQNRLVIKEGYQYGLIDLDGRLIVEPYYDWIEHHNESPLFTVIKDGKYGLIDQTGKLTTDFVYDYLCFNNGFYFATQNEKHGVINQTGNLIVPFDFDEIVLNGDLFKVKKDNKYGLINHKGETIVNLIYEEISPFINGYAKFNLSDHYGIIDHSGEIIVQAIYETIQDYSFKYGFATVEFSNKWGAINRSGDVVIDFNYNEINCLGQVFYVRTYSKAYLIDLDEKIVSELNEQTTVERDDLFIHEIMKHYKIEYGKEVITYETALYDLSGKRLTDFHYKYNEVNNHIIRVFNEWGYLDESAQERITVKYELLSPLKNELFLVKYNGYYGVLNQKEAVIYEIEYDYIVEYNDQLLLGKRGKLFFGDYNGKLSKIK